MTTPITDKQGTPEPDVPWDVEEAKKWWLPERAELKWMLAGDELKGMHAAYITEHFLNKLELRVQDLEKALRLYHEAFNETRRYINIEHQMPFRAAWEAARAALGGEGV
jgi:hypothetical protein